MSTVRSGTSKIDESALNDALVTSRTDEHDRLSMQQQRAARIDEFEQEAVERPDPFDAMDGMGQADLQRISEHLGKAILDEFDARPPTIDDVRERAPEIRLYVTLRNTMQFDNISQQSRIVPHSHGRRQLDGKAPANKRDELPPRWVR